MKKMSSKSLNNGLRVQFDQQLMFPVPRAWLAQVHVRFALYALSGAQQDLECIGLSDMLATSDILSVPQSAPSSAPSAPARVQAWFDVQLPASLAQSPSAPQESVTENAATSPSGKQLPSRVRDGRKQQVHAIVSVFLPEDGSVRAADLVTAASSADGGGGGGNAAAQSRQSSARANPGHAQASADTTKDQRWEELCAKLPV